MSKQVTQGCAFLTTPSGQESIFSSERFTDEQRMFSQSASDFLEREILPDVGRLEKQEPGLMVEKIKKAGELGLLMIDVPEKYGGLELDMVTGMLCAERMGGYASWLITVGAQTGIGMLPLLYFGTEEQKARYLPRIATGELVTAYALTEPSSGSDAMNVGTKAELVEGPDGEEYWKLTGTKMWITNGRWADLFTVFAKVDGQAFSAFLVDAPSEGLSLGAEEQKMGIKGSSTVQVNLDGVLVPKNNLLGEIGKGHKIAFNVLNIGRFKLGVGALGASKHLLTNGIRYAKERTAFGSPISEFGAIRQKIADSAVKTYALETMCYRIGGYMTEAIHGLDAEAPDYSSQVMKAIEDYAVEDSILKVHGSETMDFVCDEMLQVHGGYGFHQDYEVERFYRDSRVNRIFEGTNEINRLLLVGTVLKRTMKGQIPLFAAVQKLGGELEAPKPEVTAIDAPDHGWARFYTENAKRLVLLTANAAVQRFMTNLKDEQEVLLALADQMTALFVMDSVLARVQEFGGPGPDALLQVSVAENYNLILDLARRLAPSLTKGAGAVKHNGAIDRLTFPTNVDIIASKRIIASIMIERETWPFGS